MAVEQLDPLEIIAPAPTAAAKSSLRRPRAKVTANGTPLRWQRVEVVNTANHQADQFVVELPLFDPKAANDWKWWASTSPIEIEISVGFEDEKGSLGQLAPLVTGPADRVEMLPLSANAAARGGGRGAMLSVSGSDYSTALMNSTLTNQYEGQALTPNQIITQIAANHPELTLDMSAVSDSVGADYNDQLGRLVLHMSEWDMITALADHEGWRVRMVGKTLKVEPKSDPSSGASSSASGKGYLLSYTRDKDGTVKSNCLALRLARALSIAGGVTAVVQAHDMSTGEDANRAKATVG